MRVSWNSCLPAALVGLIASPASAADSLDAFDVDLVANLTTASVTVTLSGDDNADATAAIRLRESGGSWLDGYGGGRIAGGRLASALFGLDEGTTYEVEVTVTDPDGGPPDPWTGELTTRFVTAAPNGPTTYHVDADGDDDGAGTSAEPFATIQHAASLAVPGDVIRVQDGVYRETVTLDGLDAAADPVWIIAQNPLGAVLDGADEALWENTGGDLWEPLSGGIFRTAVPVQVSYVASDGAQLYHYESLAEMENESEGVHEAYFWDGAYLSVRLHDDSDPDTHQMAVSVLDEAFSIWNSSGVVIQGFEIRHYGSGDYPKGIYLRSSSDCVVRDCLIHHCVAPVWIKDFTAQRNLIEGNEIYDTGISDWSWDAVKGSFHEHSGVHVAGGPGTVVRNNVIHGIFNGVYTGSFSDDWNVDVAPHTDVHNNRFYSINDDPLEPEGAVHHVRLFLNRIEDALMGISVAPVNIGPLFILRNDVWQTRSSGIKLNNTPVGLQLVLHNTFYTDISETNCITTGGDGWSNVVLRNNILVGTRYVFEDTNSPGGGNDWDHDLLYTTDTERFVKWDNTTYADLAELQQGTGQEDHGLNVDPALEDPANGLLVLTANSPAVDAGLVLPGINDDYDADGPDLGATELGGTPPGPQDDDDDDDDDDMVDDDMLDDDNTDDDDDDVASDDDDEGCGCRVDEDGAWSVALLPMLLAAALFSRRRYGS